MPLHDVDPAMKRSFVYRANERFGRSRWGRGYALRYGHRLDPHIYRATGGRYPWIIGAMATAPLVTTGARSGLRREVQLAYFHDGPDVILIASNGGGDRHPHWYHNLKAHPECELGDERFRAAEVIDTDERDRLFGLADRVFSGYTEYRVKAASIGRQIPIFRLEPR
ncbi:nitroreductase/quinone reductase family protein [Gordonia amicalis]|uniref:nitroreductase/quinone reductase family protein n=1 Tax=Gordonia amicalis TaxID=89053 RepID=UPI002952EA9E|nr:nitroreductase/quinone reductase family protein [Gordonia amicalis]MDV7098894.1 nitroreductase/quinone reductase family protein [Gordonia amicalis]